VKASLSGVNAALDLFWERIEVLGVESIFNWYWFVDGLREQGRSVKLGNPARRWRSTRASRSPTT